MEEERGIEVGLAGRKGWPVAQWEGEGKMVKGKEEKEKNKNKNVFLSRKPNKLIQNKIKYRKTS